MTSSNINTTPFTASSIGDLPVWMDTATACATSDEALAYVHQQKAFRVSDRSGSDDVDQDGCYIAPQCFLTATSFIAIHFNPADRHLAVVVEHHSKVFMALDDAEMLARQHLHTWRFSHFSD